MAVSIAELLEKKEEIAARKKARYDLKTSIGTVTVKLPSRADVSEFMRLDDADELLLLDCVVEPNLRDKKLLEGFGCIEPTDVVGKLFDAGEIPALSKKIMRLAGYGQDIEAELHAAAKNV